jgi:ABC-2 type transport system permease protein
VNGLAGTGLLTRHFARRDRVIATVWVLVLAVLAFASAAATPGLYATEADRVRAATAINESGAIVALYGPVLDVTSEGELAMTKMTVLYAVFAAILVVVLVRRHTRVEEENGQTELVGGTAVGRDAPLAAAVAESVVVGLALGLLVAVGNVAGGLPVAGSVAFGAAWFGTALVAAGIAAVCAQLSASARTCAAYAAGTIAVLFLLRAVGDTTSAGWLSWLSPLGWNTQLRAYGDTRWWLLPAYVAVAGVLVGAAAVLRSHRDLGSGLVASRPGPAEGSPRLRDVFSLAVVVHAWQLALWTLAVAVTGFLFGFIAPGIEDLLDSATAQQAMDALGGEMIAAIMFVVAVVITCFGIVAVAHAGADEGSGRAEAVMATATSRAQWFGAVMAVALGGTAWLLAVSGVGLWIGYLGADGPDPGEVLVAALAWVPAAWVVVGLAALTFAWRSHWTVLAWAWPAFFLVVTLLGDLFTWPDWALDVSPYSWVPHVPAEPWSWASFLGLTAVALALCAAAWLRFRHRDIG